MTHLADPDLQALHHDVKQLKVAVIAMTTTNCHHLVTPDAAGDLLLQEAHLVRGKIKTLTHVNRANFDIFLHEISRNQIGLMIHGVKLYIEVCYWGGESCWSAEKYAIDIIIKLEVIYIRIK